MDKSLTSSAPSPTPSPSSEAAQPKRKGFISPTSSFVDFVKLESEMYTAEGIALGETYEPHPERKIRKPTTDFETCTHMLKGSVGAGLLAMPQAFLHSGAAAGVVGTLFLGAICIYSIEVLIRTQFIQCKRLQVPFITLPRSMKIALKNGPKPLRKIAWTAPIIVDFFLVTNQVGLCTAYVIFVAQSIKHVVEPTLFENLDVRIYMLMLFIPFALIILIRNLKKLAPISLTANIFIMVALCLAAYIIFYVGPFKNDEVILVNSVTTWPLFIGTVLFALEAIGVIIALEHNMENPQHFLGKMGIFPWSMVVVVVLYIAVGLLGYIKYGNDIKETIIASLPRDDWLTKVVEGIYALCIYGSYPLQTYVTLEIVWGNYLVQHIKDPRKECCVEYIMRAVVVIITFVLAMVIPHIDIMISLIGAFCLSTLGITFPFLLELCTLWPDQLGRCCWIFFKDIIFIIFGIFILFIGTYVSLYTFIVD